MCYGLASLHIELANLAQITSFREELCHHCNLLRCVNFEVRARTIESVVTIAVGIDVATVTVRRRYVPLVFLIPTFHITIVSAR